MERCFSNPMNRLIHNMRCRTRLALKGSYKDKSTIEYLGCTISELKAHLESKFKEGMNWNNYGKGWHIDHIKACAKFNLEKEVDRKKCFHFSNLQPLWASNNLSKGAI